MVEQTEVLETIFCLFVFPGPPRWPNPFAVLEAGTNATCHHQPLSSVYLHVPGEYIIDVQ